MAGESMENFCMFLLFFPKPYYTCIHIYIHTCNIYVYKYTHIHRTSVIKIFTFSFKKRAFIIPYILQKPSNVKLLSPNYCPFPSQLISGGNYLLGTSVFLLSLNFCNTDSLVSTKISVTYRYVSSICMLGL